MLSSPLLVSVVTSLGICVSSFCMSGDCVDIYLPNCLAIILSIIIDV